MRIFFGILFSVSTIFGLKFCYPLLSHLMPEKMLNDPFGFLALILAVFATAACLNAAIRNLWLTQLGTPIPVLATVFGVLGMLLIAALMFLFYIGPQLVRQRRLFLATSKQA